MNTQCKALTQDGQPCRMKAGANGYCFTHDPDRTAQRAAARRAGGIQRAGQIARAVLDEAGDEGPELKTADDILSLLSETIHQTRTGKLDQRIALAVGALCGYALRALETGKYRFPFGHHFLDPT